MSLDSSNELFSFHEFVAGQLQTPSELHSPEDCLAMWRVLHPQPQELLESTEAARLALADMAAGDAGRSARELLVEGRRKFNLGS
jgi:hypothetical protein